MALRLDGVTDEKPTEPCARCGNPSLWETWDTPLCVTCAVEWAEKAPSYADIASKYGPNADAAESFRRFTTAWLEAFKANRGAA